MMMKCNSIHSQINQNLILTVKKLSRSIMEQWLSHLMLKVNFKQMKKHLRLMISMGIMMLDNMEIIKKTLRLGES